MAEYKIITEAIIDNQIITASKMSQEKLQGWKKHIAQTIAETETEDLKLLKEKFIQKLRKAKNMMLDDKRNILRYSKDAFNTEIKIREKDKALVKMPERYIRTAGNSMKLLEKNGYFEGIQNIQISQADINKLNKPSNARIIDIICALLEDGIEYTETDESIQIDISFNDFCKVTGADLHGERRKEVWEAIKADEMAKITLIGTLQDGGIYLKQPFIRLYDGITNKPEFQKTPRVLQIRLDRIAFSYFDHKKGYTLIDRNLSKKLDRIMQSHKLLFAHPPPIKHHTLRSVIIKMFDQWDTGRKNRKGSMHISLRKLISDGKIPKPRSRKAKDELHGFLCNALISLSRETKRPYNPYSIRGEITHDDHMIIFDSIDNNGQKMLDFESPEV